jgi:hypothetical protein
MLITAFRKELKVRDNKSLDKALAWRDKKGGAMFWMRPAAETMYPQLGIRVSGDLADIHYFPEEGHAGFRCLGGKGLPVGGWTLLVYEGCDPGTGEETPNEFVVPFETARAVAREFLHTKKMSPTESWFEL